MANTVVFLWTSAAAVVLPSVAGHSQDFPSVAGTSPRSVRAEDVVPAHAVADLRDFGAARGLSFVAVSEARPLGLPANDAALVDALEGELEQARTALSALEEANASARLHKVETQLLAHPHLPQASFLMAECLALQAQAARASSPELAADLEARRLALEGPRAPAFGETPSAPSNAPRVTLEVQGLGAADELELDGARWAANTARVSASAGLHHARVWRDGQPILATFLQVAAEQSALALDVPLRVPCSGEDLRRVSREPHAHVNDPVPSGIACERWARVREDGEGIAVALCERSHCGAFQHWQRQSPAPFAPIGPSAQEQRGFPAWAGFVLAGGAAVIASSVVLWQSGAFERGRPNAATWQYGGLNPQGIRF